jgi:hypothetical protein
VIKVEHHGILSFFQLSDFPLPSCPFSVDCQVWGPIRLWKAEGKLTRITGSRNASGFLPWPLPLSTQKLKHRVV